MRPASQPVRLSVVVPTFNESANVSAMVRRLDTVLADIPWEVIFVDDASPDGTADVVRGIARTDRRVRLISRHNRRGLSSAVVEGALAAAADTVAVMDGDLQHDEGVLPALYRRVAGGQAEIASASRFLLADGAAGLSSDGRRRISDRGIRLANAMFGLDMTDPLTGFFVMRRDLLTRALPQMSELGFKVLLDIVTAVSPRPRVVELPFRFRAREHGESKLDLRVMYDFFLFFVERKLRPVLPLPPRFLSFALINGVGILVHLAVLALAVQGARLDFASAQISATMISMFFNYTANNAVTYRDSQLHGVDFWVGFAIFSALCSVGIFANIGAAVMLYEQYSDVVYLVPAMAGALVTVVWNYGATRAFVWSRKRFPGPILRRAAARA